MNNKLKRIVAFCLATLMIVMQLPITVQAKESNTLKEEVVYINLYADGTVKEIYVVNVFDLDENGKVIDYGEYESLRNMTSTNAIGYQDNTITIDASAGKLYYEGKLKSSVMPWEIRIDYYLDGIEYEADDIAGKSGNLEIKLNVSQNEACDSSFFEGYALQATILLDADKAKGIVAEGATVANVGSDKQLSYIILPNTEKEYSIKAAVTNFEMDGIAINGIRMNLDFEINDDVLQEKIDEIITAIDELDEGANKINDGVGDLSDGVSELYEGSEDLLEGATTLHSGANDLYSATGQLKDASSSLYSGITELNTGAGTLHAGLSTLSSKNEELLNGAWQAFEGLCTASSAMLNSSLAEKGMDAVTLTPENYSEVLLGILTLMDADAVYQQAYQEALKQVTEQVEAQADVLYAEYIRSQADSVYLEYVMSQADSLYRTVAYNTVLEQLVASGHTEDAAIAYLETEEGQNLVEQTVSSMTDEQKNQIVQATLQSLTDEQKEAILQGAITNLTEEQKQAIKDGYIEQMMASDEVQAQINAAVEEVSASAAEVSALKGQLDSYKTFYDGLVSYTSGVTNAANGAANLSGGTATLYTNAGTFNTAVGELYSATGTLNDGANTLKTGASDLKDGVSELKTGVSDLKDGTGELVSGTGEFVEQTSGIDTEITEEIDSMTAEISGSDVETKSFVSAENENVKSVQFVIQTEGIEIPESVETDEVVEEKLTFWQKFLRLFGLY